MAAPLKDGLNSAALTRLGQNLQRAHPTFDVQAFVDATTVGLHDLELKDRVTHVATALVAFLPPAFPEAVDIIVRAADTWDGGDPDDNMRAFAAWPLFRFIEDNGAGAFDLSMAALRKITHLFSAEFSIRPFLARDPKRAFEELKRWTDDDTEHVRRLVSESTRPRLPWAPKVQAFIDDPAPGLALLEHLKDDDALYVRRSVANHLNDVAKDHPDVVIDLCERWLEDASEERRWIVSHATRTLVKAGHPRVWGLLGFTKRPKIEASEMRVECAGSTRPHIRVGEELTFEVELSSTASCSQRLAVDYVVHYMKSNGKTKPKVFKLKTVDLAPKATVAFSKRQSFREISTRKFHLGEHAIELLVNGAPVARAEFELR